MDYIIHYGIKGQRHGIRRFQNEDGTLTEAGKERYGKDGVKPKRSMGHEVGGHQIKDPTSSSSAEDKNKSDIAKLQAEAEREVQEAIEALDRLNEAEARAQELKKKRYGEQKRFGTSGAINRARYSLKEYASYIESGKDYFKSVKKSLSKKF